MVSILLFLVVALAVAGGVLYVTKAREDQARAQERREAADPGSDDHRDGPR